MVELGDTICIYIKHYQFLQAQVAQQAEAVDLGSTQCEFESRPEYQTSSRELRSHALRVISLNLKLLDVYLSVKEVE